MVAFRDSHRDYGAGRKAGEVASVYQRGAGNPGFGKPLSLQDKDLGGCNTVDTVTPEARGVGVLKGPIRSIPLSRGGRRMDLVELNVTERPSRRRRS